MCKKFVKFQKILTFWDNFLETLSNYLKEFKDSSGDIKIT